MFYGEFVVKHEGFFMCLVLEAPHRGGTKTCYIKKTKLNSSVNRWTYVPTWPIGLSANRQMYWPRGHGMAATPAHFDEYILHSSIPTSIWVYVRQPYIRQLTNKFTVNLTVSTDESLPVSCSENEDLYWFRLPYHNTLCWVWGYASFIDLGGLKQIAHNGGDY
jgi:hypothetical protein